MRFPSENRWQRWGKSIFSEMSEAATRFQAVNLAQGFPNFEGPQRILTAAAEALASGRNQYAPSPGIPELRRCIAARYRTRYGLSYDPGDQITVLSGATEAIFCSLMALARPGSEVLTLAPYYESYPVGAFAAGATLRTVNLEAPSWRLDLDRLAAAITPETSVLLLNTPHNPSGRVFSRQELEGVRELALRHDLWVITDEVYEEITFDDAEHIPLATLPEMYERTVTISSTSKNFSLTGWKIGYACASAEVSRWLRTVHQATVFSSATPLQWGMVAAFDLLDDYYRELRVAYRNRRDTLVSGLREAGFTCVAPEGAYFVIADFCAHSSADDRAFAQQLAADPGVAVIPISPFYDEGAPRGLIRVSFCKDEATLREAGARLLRLGKGGRP